MILLELKDIPPDLLEFFEPVSLDQKRDVFNISTQPFKDAHFAVFPPKLIEPCILAGCPSKVCAECGAPWERVAEKKRATFPRRHDPSFITGRAGMNRERPGKSDSYVLSISQFELASMLKSAANGREAEMIEIFGSKWAHWTRTDKSGARVPTFRDAEQIKEVLGIDIPFDGIPTGHRPTCQCNADTTKGITLDPFIGSGTTAFVAIENGRDWLGFELNEEYKEMAYKRIAKARVPISGLEPGGDNGHQPQQATLFDITQEV